MPSFSISSSYLLPAILVNPAFILHLINTFVSYWAPPPPIPSASPYPNFEKWGPLPGSTLYLDMHADDRLCWSYTVIMVIVQFLAFGRVQDNRVRRHSAKVAKAEREKVRKEKLQALEEQRLNKMKINGNGSAKISVAGLDGIWDDILEEPKSNYINGNGQATKQSAETESEASLTETSEEEIFI
ncbi:hypothetical protein B0O99DRAFT_651850 [Bisporella sp. PMI_857]|nr:hypothetical protein B0O99DRAFT_651850 [Bisporella sp. PMI_857]